LMIGTYAPFMTFRTATVPADEKAGTG
jgi:hypothetical protein